MMWTMATCSDMIGAGRVLVPWPQQEEALVVDPVWCVSWTIVLVARAALSEHAILLVSHLYFGERQWSLLAVVVLGSTAPDHTQTQG